MKPLFLFFGFVAMLSLWACGGAEPSGSSATNKQQKDSSESRSVNTSLGVLDTLPEPRPSDTSMLEFQMINAGLVNVQDLEPDIMVLLKYATSDNFLDENVYGDIENAYLQKEAAEKLAIAHKHLIINYPDLRLIVFDGARPRSVQYQMWDLVKGTDQQSYVASPKSGSIHNYGAAVDLGLATTDGKLVDMGTKFDYFGELAEPRHEARFLASGELTQAQVGNRRILRAVMLAAGFHGLLNEWWHFNAFPREETKRMFGPIE